MSVQLFAELFDLYEQAFRMRIIENDHLLRPSFHLLCSCILEHCYVYAGKYKYTKTDVFIIQKSGTGKGEVLQLVDDIVRYLGLSSSYVQSFTEAGIIGTIQKIKNLPHPRLGEIAKCVYVAFDEAKPLINPNDWSKEIKSVLNGFLESRYINRPMALGNLQYTGKAVLATGTFEFENMNNTLLEDGFLQRWLVTYHTFNSYDVLRINTKLTDIAKYDYQQHMEPVFNKIKDKYEKIKQNLKRYTQGLKRVIRLDDEAVKYLAREVNSYHENYLIGKYKDEAVQSLIDSFIARSHFLGYRIASHYAVINNFDTINMEAVKYAVPLVKNHLISISRFVSDGLELGKYNIGNRSMRDVAKKRATQLILEYIKKQPGSSKSDIRQYHQNSPTFPIGENATARLLNDLILQGKIRNQRDRHNKSRLYIK